jgi:hypothetical protein
MYRFYMNTNRNETGILQEVIRTDGGWWFSEETSEGRLVYEVIDRKEISPGHVLELLKPLPQDFVQLPCWQQAPQVWQVHRKEGQGGLRSLGDLQILEWWPETVEPAPGLVPGRPGLVPGLAPGQPGLVPGLASGRPGLVPGLAPGLAPGQPGLVPGLASGQPEPCQQPLIPHWIRQEVDHLHSIIQICMKNMGSLPIVYQEVNVSYPLIEKQQEKVVQKKGSSQHRKALKALPSQHVQRSSEQFQKQVSSSPQGKELKMGQLCSPSFVPDQQSSRVLLYHPSKPQKQSSQVNYTQCQIVQG